MSLTLLGGLQRLFGYIQGHNEANVTIPMTVPVKVEVIPGEVGLDFLKMLHLLVQPEILLCILEADIACALKNRACSVSLPLRCRSTCRSGSGTTLCCRFSYVGLRSAPSLCSVSGML
jgi:SOUL heme-binding protein